MVSKQKSWQFTLQLKDHPISQVGENILFLDMISGFNNSPQIFSPNDLTPVSYTHLTLPTTPYV